MPDLPALRALLVKLEAATEGSLELDFAIGDALDLTETHGTNPDLLSVECYTTSLDAAVSLVEAVLPGWHWEIGSDGHACLSWNDPRSAFLADNFDLEIHASDDECNVPIVLCTAAVMALIAQAEAAPRSPPG